MAREPAARVVCVAPSHQFPLGVTMSVARRLELLAWAQQAGAWILEDDYDSEYRYASRPLACLQGLDETGCVVYIGTFSKTVFPSLRLGYVIAPRGMVDALQAARAAADRHSPALEQSVLADFIGEGHYARHVRRMRALYEERRDALRDAVEQRLAGAADAGLDGRGDAHRRLASGRHGRPPGVRGAAGGRGGRGADLALLDGARCPERADARVRGLPARGDPGAVERMARVLERGARTGAT